MFKYLLTTCLIIAFILPQTAFAGQYDHCKVRHYHRGCRTNPYEHRSSKVVYAKPAYPYGHYAQNPKFSLQCNHPHYHKKNCYRKIRTHSDGAMVAGAIILGSLIALGTHHEYRERPGRNSSHCRSRN